MPGQGMKTQAQRRLAVFLALSLLIHLIWFLGDRPQTIQSPRQDGRQLAVYITETGASSEAPEPARRAQRPIVPAAKTPVPAPSQDPGQTARRPAPQKANARFEQVARAKILGTVQQRLVEDFVYPRLARRRGWQGRVLLGFQVGTGGTIQHVHVKQSSGYAILDDSAVNAMNKLGVIGLQKEELLNRVWHLEIPIIYRLEG